MRLLLPLALIAAAPVTAQPRLSLPIDCTLGDTCHIQAYTDVDPTEGAVDYTCGTLAYDSHKGTDFALPNLAALQAGVDVLASAPGRVRALRDGERDVLYDGTSDLGGRDCGNGVVIDHGDGWETQYCHLRNGSVAVAQGDEVEAGTVLGKVGLSGRTQFPHVHLSVRHAGEVVDPFAPGAEPGACGAAEETLWQDPPPYRPGGLIAAGFAPAIPEYAEIKAGTGHTPALIATTPALVLWGFGYGSRAGDVMRLVIKGPDGRTTFETEVEIEKPQAQYFRASGTRVRRGLRPGTYTGSVTLLRDGRPYDSRDTHVEIR